MSLIAFKLSNTLSGKLHEFPGINQIINDGRFKQILLLRIAEKIAENNKKIFKDIEFLIENGWNKNKMGRFVNLVINLKRKNFAEINVKDVEKWYRVISFMPEVKQMLKENGNKDLLYDVLDYNIAKNWFDTWVRTDTNRLQIHHVPRIVEKYCVRKSYKELYRGMSWDLKGEFQIHNLFTGRDYSTYKKNDIVQLDFRYLTSWTPLKRQAEHFANKKNYGIVLKIKNIKKQDIFCDLNESLFAVNNVYAGEDEIIFYPNRLKCEIVEIFYNRKLVDSIRDIGVDREVLIQ